MTRRCAHPEVLADGPICQVERCRDCKCISIHMGAATVRLEESALASVWATLEEALTNLHRRGLLQAEAPAAGLTRAVPRGSA
jgi:hypothetical protein